MCVDSNRWQILDLLIKKGANVNVMNSCGDYAIERALALKHDKLIRLLVASPTLNLDETLIEPSDLIDYINPSLVNTLPNLIGAVGMFKPDMEKQTIKTDKMNETFPHPSSPY